MAYKYIVEKKGRKFVVVDSGHMTTPHGPYTTEREAQKTADYLTAGADKSENDRLASFERQRAHPARSKYHLTQPQKNLPLPGKRQQVTPAGHSYEHTVESGKGGHCEHA